MTAKLPTLLMALALSASAHAAPSAEAEATFQHAMHMGEANRQWFERLVEQEQNGQLDKKILTDSVKDLASKTQTFLAELRKASDDGHAVASYMLANVETRHRPAGSTPAAQQAQACALYKTAADQGLLAAAVAQLSQCDAAMQRFKFDEPEQVQMRAALLKALQTPDPYANYYPLPALRSLCFQDNTLPAFDKQRPIGALKQAMEPVQLDLAQYRADGYYLLAMYSAADQPTAQAHLKALQALNTQCQDPLGLARHYQRQG